MMDPDPDWAKILDPDPNSMYRYLDPQHCPCYQEVCWEAPEDQGYPEDTLRPPQDHSGHPSQGQDCPRVSQGHKVHYPVYNVQYCTATDITSVVGIA